MDNNLEQNYLWVSIYLVYTLLRIFFINKADQNNAQLTERRRQLNLIGHVLRMKNEAHAPTTLGWRPEGKRGRRRPKTT
jgi:hypothetical protein